MAEVASRFERARGRFRLGRRAAAEKQPAEEADPVARFEKHLAEIEEAMRRVKEERDEARRERDALKKKYEG